MEHFTTRHSKENADCGGLLAYNYFSGEHITGFEEGRPLFVRTTDSNFNLANFMRVHLFTALGALKTGCDILLKQEKVKVDNITGHGGLFKTKGVGQSILAAAMNAPVSVMETAGEGGAWESPFLHHTWLTREAKLLMSSLMMMYSVEKQVLRWSLLLLMLKDLTSLLNVILQVFQSKEQQLTHSNN